MDPDELVEGQVAQHPDAPPGPEGEKADEDQEHAGHDNREETPNSRPAVTKTKFSLVVLGPRIDCPHQPSAYAQDATTAARLGVAEELDRAVCAVPDQSQPGSSAGGHDTIGGTDAATRRTEPRIAARQ